MSKKLKSNIIKLKKGDYLNNTCLRIGICIFLILASVVFVSTTPYDVFVTRNATEIPIIKLHPVYQLYIFLIAALILVKAQGILSKIQSRILFMFLILLVTLVCVYLAFNLDTYLRVADPGVCVRAARDFNLGKYSELHNGGYLCMYPYQLYWVSWLRILLSIHNSVRFLYYFNALISVATIVCIYAITCELIQNDAVRNNAIILAALFLPVIFNTLFVYANVLALFLTTFSIWLLIHGINNQKYSYVFCSLFPVVVASLIKNNYLIALIAFFIVLFFTKIKKLRVILMLLISVCFITFSNLTINHYYSEMSHTTVNVKSGVPKSGFIVMGLQENGPKSGWFSDFTWQSYNRNHHSAKKIDQESKKHW